ncbi:MAG TPA: M56 family metallopeptidase [Bryobacteraceae bacterium]|jgi:TonB family protein|nr:M56 family metallopeptidase [Bryobacteraceae bacterium]
MSAALVWSNLLAYSLEAGLLVALAAPMPAVLRLRAPRARLAYWHILLAACLALPWVRPWHQAVVTGEAIVTTRILAVGAPAAPARALPSPQQIALALLAAGAVARLLWLAAGMWRLRRYRRDSCPLAVDMQWTGRAAVRVAEGVSGPVTFGLWRPVILVPPRFAELPEDARRVILFHERLHVERGDWLFTVAEELVRAVLWFHPAIWWLLGEIQLSREQAVDAEVVRLTGARDAYVEALLAAAGGRDRAPLPDLLPAPLFLRKRHLKKRVIAIFEEVRMSKTRVISALSAGLCVMAAAGWLATAAFPLAAAPQVVNDAPGVTVDTGGAALLHRTGVAYPEAARAAGVQGTVTLEVKLDARGNVADAHVLSGPDELRRPALQSVLQWHFASEPAWETRQVTVSFSLPRPGAVAVKTVNGGTTTVNLLAGGSEKERAAVTALAKAQQRAGIEGRTVRMITISGLSPQLKDELSAKLPIHVGDTISKDLAEQTTSVVKAFDEHLTMFTAPMEDNQAAIQIVAPGAAAGAPETGTPPALLRVGGNMQAAKLIRQPRPIYPPEAKAQRIQGKVTMTAVIGKDGRVIDLRVTDGEPILAAAAMNAVWQWVYEPTLLNGEPVEVQTQIDVNFTLSQ